MDKRAAPKENNRTKVVLMVSIALSSWAAWAAVQMGAGVAMALCLIFVQGWFLYFFWWTSERTPFSVGVKEVLLVALLLRLPYLFSPVVLSDDIYRYLFDGLVQGLGANPYGVSPQAFITTDPIVSKLAEKVNHGGLVTLYPPVAQLFFRLAAPLGLVGMKALLVGCELLASVLLMGILKARSLPLSRAALFAWSPLVVWEVAWSGHIDALALPLILFCVILVERESWWSAFLAGCCFAMAFWVKLIPAIFFPVLLLGMRRVKARVPLAAMGAILVSVGCMTLYLPEIENALETLHVYGTTWEFSGFLFRVIRDITGMNFLARIFLSIGFGSGLILLLRAQWAGRFDTSTALVWCASLWMLTTPTLHPWYGLYLASFVPLMEGKKVFRMIGERGSEPLKYTHFIRNGASLWLMAPYVLTLTPLLGYVILIEFIKGGVWVESSLTSFFIAAPPVVLAFFAMTRAGFWLRGSRRLMD